LPHLFQRFSGVPQNPLRICIRARNSYYLSILKKSDHIKEQYLIILLKLGARRIFDIFTQAVRLKSAAHIKSSKIVIRGIGIGSSERQQHGLD
jgi:hypothetical protein